MSKHLIIGLGGTGLTMTRALRCIISEELVTTDVRIQGRTVRNYHSPDNDTPHDVQIRYLEIDTSSRDLKVRFKGSSPVSGPTLLLGENYQLNAMANDTQGAEQIRSQGAELFSTHAVDFDQKVQRLMEELGGDRDLSVHVCAGLGGGTGSGAIVDAVCRLRQLCPHNGDTPSSVKIYLYVTLPQRNYPHAQAQYEANGYAALAELSSLNTRQWTPSDKNPGLHESRPYRFETAPPVRDILQPVFSSCYLFDQNNENGHNYRTAGCADPMSDQIAQLMGYFLFQKLFVWSRARNERGDQSPIITNLSRADSSENLGRFQFEYSYDYLEKELLGRENNKILRSCQRYAIHSKRFQAIGLKRLIVPVQEMKRHWAAVLANEALLQLRYNELADAGYLDPEALLETAEQKERYQNCLAAKISDKRNAIAKKLTSWKLDDKSLTYQSPIQDNESHIVIEDRWRQNADFLAPRLKASQEPWRDWCVSFYRSMANIFESSYHQRPNTAAQGVCEFYHSLHAQIRDRATIHIHSFWVQQVILPRLITNPAISDDTTSLIDIDLLVKALYQYICGENSAISNYSNQLRRIEIQLNSLTEEERQRREAYNKMGVIGGVIYRERRFNEYTEIVKQLFIVKTKEEALRYAMLYLGELARQTASLQNVTTNILSRFDKTLRGLRNEQGGLLEEGIQSLIRTNCPGDYNVHEALNNDICVKLYNPASILDFSTRFRCQEELRQANLTRVRTGLLEQIRRERSISDLNLEDIFSYFDGPDFKQYLMSVCMDTLNNDERFNIAFNFNINGEIFRHFTADQGDLGDLIQRTSGFAIATSPTEIGEAKPSNVPINMHLRPTTAVFISGIQRNLVASLQDTLRGHFGEAGMAEINIQTELSVTRIENGLPVRAFSRVQELEYAYKNCLRDNFIGLHTDGEENPCFPQFFPTKEEIKQLYRGTSQDYVTQPKHITDNRGYGSLFKRYLLGLVQESQNDLQKTTWSTTSADHHEIQRFLTLKMHDFFLIEDFLSAVDESVEKAHQNEEPNQLSFTMRHLYKEMKETERKWRELTAPSYLTTEIATLRQAALERLNQATEAVKTRYPNSSGREYIHILTLHQYYSRQLGDVR